MVQTQLDFDEARRRRDAGIAQSIATAQDEHADWKDLALAFLFRELMDGKRQFRIEEIRESAERFRKVPDPPSRRAWGAVAVTAAKRGWIRKIGYQETTNPKSHATPATLWESLL
jgi:hypothetical protein